MWACCSGGILVNLDAIFTIENASFKKAQIGVEKGPDAPIKETRDTLDLCFVILWLIEDNRDSFKWV